MGKFQSAIEKEGQNHGAGKTQKNKGTAVN